MGIRFGLLGPLALTDASGPRTLTGTKSRLLLAALLLHANRAVPVEQLQTVLWHGHPPRTARSSLHNHAARLRRDLGPEGGARLRAVPSGYLIEVNPGELDSEAFTGHLGRARTARRRQDWPAVRDEVSAALALWRGRPLADLPDLPDRPEVATLVEQHLQALEWHYDAQLQEGRHDGLGAELAALTAEHPLREEFHRQLMLVLHRAGRTAEALAVHGRLRRTLVEELGVEPGAAVRDTHQRILAPAPPVTPPAPPPLGRRLLIDQLPAGVADFTGRAAELGALRVGLGADRSADRSADGTAGRTTPRVVVVCGMGGIGKTTLALRAAHGLEARYPDGRLHADLRGAAPERARSAHDLLARLLTDLGTDARHVPDHTDDRAALYRAVLAERRILVVLDDARDTGQVLPLLPGSGGSAAIVTSRRTLAALPGAARVSLGPMTGPEQHRLLTAVCGADRIAADRPSAERILTACAGLPLAVRIAATRLAARPGEPPATLARRLAPAGGRLDVLALDHLAVRETFRTSYRALLTSPDPLARDAARAFRLLGLRPDGPLGPPAVHALLGEGQDRAADLLDVLVERHLLERPGPDAYRLHPLLGAFAAELAAAEEPAAARARAGSRLRASARPPGGGPPLSRAGAS
ncbi:BTAD domain-containing putative transcriptional regulator [Kitasatospora sp. NPDC088346]|uniref:AfsR/SARP family transcriptional regulator n=1 Tax=Kitasatospora sp. NPDC088346 TaxID=3364073 RepID=UPI00381BDFD2